MLVKKTKTTIYNPELEQAKRTYVSKQISKNTWARCVLPLLFDREGQGSEYLVLKIRKVERLNITTGRGLSRIGLYWKSSRNSGRVSRLKRSKGRRDRGLEIFVAV